MKLVKGHKTVELTKTDFEAIVTTYTSVCVDLGTGDGRFVYKEAQAHPDTLYIGVDTNDKQLAKFSVKALRKKLKNALFVLGSLEHIPQELEQLAQELHIILPWGSLLAATARPEYPLLRQVAALVKPHGSLHIILGYAAETEPSETERLALADFTIEYIEHQLLPIYDKLGLKLTQLNILNKRALKNIGTTWSNRLSFGKNRPVFDLHFIRL